MHPYLDSFGRFSFCFFFFFREKKKKAFLLPHSWLFGEPHQVGDAGDGFPLLDGGGGHKGAGGHKEEVHNLPPLEGGEEVSAKDRGGRSEERRVGKECAA